LYHLSPPHTFQSQTRRSRLERLKERGERITLTYSWASLFLSLSLLWRVNSYKYCANNTPTSTTTSSYFSVRGGGEEFSSILSFPRISYHDPGFKTSAASLGEKI
jgi:hypothetical protein